MFGLGWMEIGAILAIALVVFGPKKLPELARKLGEGLREFRSATESFKATVNQEAHKAPAPAPYPAPTADEHEGPVPPDQLTEGSPPGPGITDAEVVQAPVNTTNGAQNATAHQATEAEPESISPSPAPEPSAPPKAASAPEPSPDLAKSTGGDSSQN